MQGAPVVRAVGAGGGPPFHGHQVGQELEGNLKKKKKQTPLVFWKYAKTAPSYWPAFTSKETPEACHGLRLVQRGPSSSPEVFSALQQRPGTVRGNTNRDVLPALGFLQ